jgi:hypothetical protein
MKYTIVMTGHAGVADVLDASVAEIEANSPEEALSFFAGNSGLVNELYRNYSGPGWHQGGILNRLYAVPSHEWVEPRWN